MNIIVFGASGGIGKQIVKQAIAAGHEVTAFQHTTALPVEFPKILRVIQGDLLDISSVRTAMQGQEVVLATHGAHSLTKVEVYTEGTDNILSAMKEYGVRRIVCITSAAVDDDPALGFFFGKIIKPLFLKNVYHGLKHAEQSIKQSGLDWTIVGPGKLTDGPYTGTYRISTEGIPKGGSQISRADVADLMIKEATDTQSIGKKLVVVD